MTPGALAAAPPVTPDGSWRAELVAGLRRCARVGAVRDMIAAGVGLPAMLRAGPWESVALVNRYGKRPPARCRGAALLARRQGRARPPQRKQP